MKPVVPRSWRECARYYLTELWVPVDRPCWLKFASEVECEVLHGLAVDYSFVRSISGHIGSPDDKGGYRKYKPLADMLNSHRSTLITRENVAEIIDREVENMRSVYGKRLWSAISKAFWMLKRHPVAIFDGYADKGLRKLGFKPGEKTYRQYFDAWFAFFEQEETIQGLDDAIKWLAGLPETQRLLEQRKMNLSELNSLWFRSRVADMKLCVYGGAPWLDEDEGCR